MRTKRILCRIGHGVARAEMRRVLVAGVILALIGGMFLSQGCGPSPPGDPNPKPCKHGSYVLVWMPELVWVCDHYELHWHYVARCRYCGVLKP
jgi:hypothetical protein